MPRLLTIAGFAVNGVSSDPQIPVAASLNGRSTQLCDAFDKDRQDL